MRDNRYCDILGKEQAMLYECWLTVAQSKRLIARAVAKMDVVRKALKEGYVVVAAGTTNTYVLEEILGEKVEHFSFTSGITTPVGKKPDLADIKNRRMYLVIEKGEPKPDVTSEDALKNFGSGDVFIKGANALNYAGGIAGMLIGHPMGGTIGAALGPVTGRKAHLIIPVGLEKEIPHSIIDLAQQVPYEEHRGKVCGIFPFTGTIVTEIEAFNILYDVEAFPVAAGGISGAEGGVRFHISGNEASLKNVEKGVSELREEHAFGK